MLRRYICLSRISDFVIYTCIILGDPGADSGGEGKSEGAEKYGTKKSLLFFLPYFPARLDFPPPQYLPLGLRGCIYM